MTASQKTSSTWLTAVTREVKDIRMGLRENKLSMEGLLQATCGDSEQDSYSDGDDGYDDTEAEADDGSAEEGPIFFA